VNVQVAIDGMQLDESAVANGGTVFDDYGRDRIFSRERLESLLLPFGLHSFETGPPGTAAAGTDVPAFTIDAADVAVLALIVVVTELIATVAGSKHRRCGEDEEQDRETEFHAHGEPSSFRCKGGQILLPCLWFVNCQDGRERYFFGLRGGISHQVTISPTSSGSGAVVCDECNHVAEQRRCSSVTADLE
jgi:hypothetical protein